MFTPVETAAGGLSQENPAPLLVSTVELLNAVVGVPVPNEKVDGAGWDGEDELTLNEKVGRADVLIFNVTSNEPDPCLVGVS